MKKWKQLLNLGIRFKLLVTDTNSMGGLSTCIYYVTKNGKVWEKVGQEDKYELADKDLILDIITFN